MNHKGTQPLYTCHLYLRPHLVEDADAMYSNWANDPQVTRYLTWPPHENVEVSRAILREWAAGYEKQTYYQWAILPTGGDMPIGSIGAVHMDPDVGSVELGYCLGRKWWGGGLMTEALQAVLAFFLEEVGAGRVAARHDTNNPASGRVMEKAGMQYEGTLRRSGRNQQGICDMAVYAVVQDIDENL